MIAKKCLETLHYIVLTADGVAMSQSVAELHKKCSLEVQNVNRRKTWCVGVCFGDVGCGELRWLLLAPDAQLLFRHLSLYPPVVLLGYSLNVRLTYMRSLWSSAHNCASPTW